MNDTGPSSLTPRFSFMGLGIFKHSDDEEEEAEIPVADCCDVCDENEDDLFFCQDCKWNFCAGCWKAQAVHKAKKQASLKTELAKSEHAKIPLSVVKLVQPAFSTPPDDKSLQKRLAEEEDAAWFGVGREVSKDSPLFFHDYGRYAGLMTATNKSLQSLQSTSLQPEERPFPSPRAPSLVSFVGQTGAGKSTLIKLLIHINESNKALKYHCPVAGLPGKDVPTSEDVHLYLDPASSLSDTPMLYADCEGIDGGAREPMATTLRNEREAAETEKWYSKQTTSNQPTSKRELQWAKSPLERTRQFAVSKFYPRLLFTFSDVVVFVHRNPRTVEAVLEKLIEWATDALEASYNHPVLPHAIIVQNASHADIHKSLWDVDIATQELLKSLSRTLNHNVTFAQYAKFWKARGREIETVEDLMLCYYSSVRVVRLPADTQPKLVLEQAQKLYTEITLGCKAARESKSELRMLLNEDSLQYYLQHAFDHYSRTLEIPFDFVQASFLYNPIPANFGGSILKLAIALKDQQIAPQITYFPQYIRHLDYALSTFCDQYWPCEFVVRTVPDHIRYDLSTFKYQNDLRTDRYYFRCANARCGHGSKGHQLEDGRILSRGDYMSKFSFRKNRDGFHGGVYYILEELLSQLPGKVDQKLQQAAATELHLENIQEFLHRDGKENNAINLSDHRVCWCCLFEPPEHTLSCGHVLCTSCVKEYGYVKSRTMVEILECPLELNSTSPPQSIYFKPKAAGIRVLLLDDGGIRSFMQIEVLRLLENEFNNQIPVQFFFDLIIGNGSGSIPALGLFVSNWTMGKCEENFLKICKKSFAKDNFRRFRNLPRRLGRSSKSKYGSSALEKSLKEAFTESEPLFGGSSASKLGTNTKVAIPAIPSSTSKTTLFPNYNRLSLTNLPYKLFRPENEQNEVKLWEAARASMSNQQFFKPFKHKSSNEVYSHQETNISNPITIADTEYKATWQDLPSDYPDLLLWIGTGITDRRFSRPDRTSSGNSTLKSAKGRLTKSKKESSLRHSSEDCHESIWDDYLNRLPINAPARNFTRFNIKIPEPPAADDVDSLEFFQNVARECINVDEIKALASQIFATFFYFDGEIEETASKELFLRGEILCRISDLTPPLREIGILLQSGSKFSSTGFTVQLHSQPLSSRFIELTSSTIDDMIFNLHFQMPPVRFRVFSKTPEINIEIRFENSTDYSISGFPRTFNLEEQSRASAKKSRSGSGEDNPTVITRRQQWIPPDRNQRLSLSSHSSASTSIRSFGANNPSEHSLSHSSATSPRELESPRSLHYELSSPVERRPPQRLSANSNSSAQEAGRIERQQEEERDRIRGINEELSPLEERLSQNPIGTQEGQPASPRPTKNTKEIHKMVNSIPLLLASFASAAAATASADCTRAFLKNATDTYLAAQSAGQPNILLPLTTTTTLNYTENDSALSPLTGILSTALPITHNLSIYDTTACSTFTELISVNTTTTTQPYVIGTRMLFSPTGKIATIESVVTTTGDWLFNATAYLKYTLAEAWAPIPIEKRESRAVIQSVGDAYFNRFDNASVVVPWGLPCARLEGGSYFSANLSTETGYCAMAFPSTIKVTNRRYVVDEEMGVVDIFLGFPGLDRTQGQLPMPDSHAFKVEGGKIKFLHTITIEALKELVAPHLVTCPTKALRLAGSLSVNVSMVLKGMMPRTRPTFDAFSTPLFMCYAIACISFHAQSAAAAIVQSIDHVVVFKPASLRSR
ncbi:hypothetical protein G7Y89_g1060 [Cudoniella acicularis]|uniref:PNPLA domain-containing protein n=1 Tax=Cudoniella acicularis TaxID=354080 RepID=A0A8H4RW06_9HELO|nr:hypothetical protein G7Y89_g1060 [Cudoniella acicularis]